MRDRRRRLLLSPPLLLVALATILATILGAGTVSASASHGPETRVRATPTAMADAVGQHSSETAGSVGCLRPSQPGFAPGSCVATESVRPPSSPNYSVAYEAQLPEGAFPGRSAEYHFSKANRQLHGAFESDPAFAASMEAQYPCIVDGVSHGPRGGLPG